MCLVSDAVQARSDAARALLAAAMGIPVVPEWVLRPLRALPAPNLELDALVAEIGRKEAKP